MNAHVSLDEQILAMRAAGLSYKRIAAHLDVSQRRVSVVADPTFRQRERERSRQSRNLRKAKRPPCGAARDWLFLDAEPGPVKIDDVKRAACEHFGVASLLLTARKRDLATVYRRHVGIYLACEETGRPLPHVGRAFGGLDHTTVLHARRKIASAIAAGDRLIIADVEAIRARFARVSERKGVAG